MPIWQRPPAAGQHFSAMSAPLPQHILQPLQSLPAPLSGTQLLVGCLLWVAATLCLQRPLLAGWGIQLDCAERLDPPAGCPLQQLQLGPHYWHVPAASQQERWPATAAAARLGRTLPCASCCKRWGLATGQPGIKGGAASAAASQAMAQCRMARRAACLSLVVPVLMAEMSDV